MNKIKQSLTPESENSKVENAKGLAKRPFLFLGLTLVLWFPLVTLLHSWVLVLFWAWFIVPQFGADPLSLPIAAGFDVLFGFLVGKNNGLPTHSEAAKEKNKELSWTERISRMFVPNFGLSLLRVGITLLFGFVIHIFVRH